MMSKFIARLIFNFVGFGASVFLLDGIAYSDDPWVLVIAALIFSIVNMFLKPILVVLSLPFIVVTLGLFTVIINGALLYLTDSLYDSFSIESFGVTVLAALIISFVNMVLTTVFGDK